MTARAITLTIAGPAGYGINAAGELMARSFTRGGLNVMAYLEYPSLIRGGVNSYHLRVDAQTVNSHEPQIDLLVVLNKEAWEVHRYQVPPGGVVIHDASSFSISAEEAGELSIDVFPIPLTAMVKEKGGIELMRNTMAVGATLGLLDYPLDFLEGLLQRQFEHKGKAIVEQNQQIARAGYDFIKQSVGPKEKWGGVVMPTGKDPLFLMSGNAAISYGAMQAGCKLFAAYPMTPASSILTVFAEHEQEMDIVVKQPEDEIAAVLYAVGAGFAGVRAMTSTSGGGFALMNEALSLAGMVEVPLVVVESQRPGPATGLPTWTGQADLQYVIHAGHDEFPRCVMAPGDLGEAFELTQQAFNIAERYHMPVIVMSDKYLSESLFSIPSFEDLKMPIDRGPLMTSEEGVARKGVMEDYPRYRFTESGVSPRSLPGMADARYVANSNEHDENGDVDETAENRKLMHEKRLRKMDTLKKELPPPVLYGEETFDVLLLGWGSTKGVALEAIARLKQEGIRASYLHPKIVFPFPTETFRSYLEKSKVSLLIEGNHDAQWGQCIRQNTLLDAMHRLLKYDGRPFEPNEIVEKVKFILKS